MTASVHRSAGHRYVPGTDTFGPFGIILLSCLPNGPGGGLAGGHAPLGLGAVQEICGLRPPSLSGPATMVSAIVAPCEQAMLLALKEPRWPAAAAPMITHRNR